MSDRAIVMTATPTPTAISRRCASLLAILLLTPASLLAQGSLPAPPSGFTWQSQGVMVYTDSNSFTVDLGQSGVPGGPGLTTLDETIHLTAYDATPGTNQHVLVHASTYSISLDALGSVVVVNLDSSPASFNGSVSFDNWGAVLGSGGGGLGGGDSDNIINSSYSLGSGSGGLFNNGVGKSSVAVSIGVAGTAPTDGSAMDFNFDGDYFVVLNGSTPNALWFASGSGRGEAGVQTVYERFDLVVVPEPSVLLLLLGAAAVGLRRRRA